MNLIRARKVFEDLFTPMTSTRVGKARTDVTGCVRQNGLVFLLFKRDRWTVCSNSINGYAIDGEDRYHRTIWRGMRKVRLGRVRDAIPALVALGLFTKVYGDELKQFIRDRDMERTRRVDLGQLEAQADGYGYRLVAKKKAA